MTIAARRAVQGASGDRWRALVDRAFRIQAIAIYLFLYLPIGIVVLFSFNESRFVTDWQGFSTRWYEEVWLGDQKVQRALWNSLTVAWWNAVLATLFGTLAALALQRVGKRVRTAFEAVTYASIIVPEIVIALATLIFFRTTFDIVNPILAAAFGGARPPTLGLGLHTMIAAHMLFNISVVLLLVRARLAGMDRTHVEASYDLYGSPWRTFWQITLPQLLPAIVAGFLLSFTFSFDDYIISTFVSGVGSTTLPLFVFGEVRRGVTPRINAVAAVMLLITLVILFVAQWTLQRRSPAARTAAAAGRPIEGP